MGEGGAAVRRSQVNEINYKLGSVIQLTHRSLRRRRGGRSCPSCHKSFPPPRGRSSPPCQGPFSALWNVEDGWLKSIRSKYRDRLNHFS